MLFPNVSARMIERHKFEAIFLSTSNRIGLKAIAGGTRQCQVLRETIPALRTWMDMLYFEGKIKS